VWPTAAAAAELPIGQGPAERRQLGVRSGVEGQMDRAKRIHLGGGSNGAIPPTTDSTRRVAVEEANV